MGKIDCWMCGQHDLEGCAYYCTDHDPVDVMMKLRGVLQALVDDYDHRVGTQYDAVARAKDLLLATV